VTIELLKGRALITAGMKHAAHVSAEAIAEARDKTPPHLRAAVIDGDPTMGSGNVYQVYRSDIEYDYIKDSKGKYIDVPAHWKRIGGLDVGHNVTAYLSGAYDADNDTLYVIDEFGAEQQPPAVIVAGIKHRKGHLHPIMIDPASRGRSQVDGRQLIVEYRKEGLNVRPADNAVEAGIHAVWDRLSTGRLKIFKHCTKTFKEYEMYQRDVNGKVVKKNDHFMDALRYLVMGLRHAKLIYQNETPTHNYTNRYQF
jgi:hypothetical protein